MLTFILASSERETGGYLEEKIRAAHSVTILTVCHRTDELLNLIKLHHPDGLLLDISAEPDALLSLVEEVQRAFPSLLVVLACQKFKCDQDLLLRSMRLGVRGFLPLPLEEEIETTIQQLTRPLSSDRPRGPAKRGRLVAVLSSKGGSGSTLIASNLAVSFARHSQKSTALVDLNLQLGDVSLFLDLKPHATVADLAKNSERLDAILLREMMITHPTGVNVLAAPKVLEEAGLLTHAHLQKAYALLKSIFEWVVVDLPVAFDEPMLTTLQNADEILLVTLLNIPSLRNAKRYLDIFWRLGIPRERVRVIVNRYDRKDEGALSLKDAGSALEQPVFFTIPNNYVDVITAINGGKPLVDVAADRPIVKAFDGLADRLNRPARGPEAPGDASKSKNHPSKPGVFARLFQRKVEVD
jgi:pilus assembly protein CpaE